MAEMRMTDKEERFCQHIVSGMDPAGAYRAVYSTNCNDNTAICEASRILGKEKVIARLRELRKPIEEALTASNAAAIQEQIEFIKGRIELCRLKEDENSIIRYTDMLNRIFGAYNGATKEVEEEGKLASLDTDALKRIAETVSSKA